MYQRKSGCGKNVLYDLASVQCNLWLQLIGNYNFTKIFTFANFEQRFTTVKTVTFGRHEMVQGVQQVPSIIEITDDKRCNKVKKMQLVIQIIRLFSTAVFLNKWATALWWSSDSLWWASTLPTLEPKHYTISVHYKCNNTWLVQHTYVAHNWWPFLSKAQHIASNQNVLSVVIFKLLVLHRMRHTHFWTLKTFFI